MAATDDSPASSGGGGGGGAEEFMLFGVRVVVDSMRKSVSLNNLSQYEQPNQNNDDKNENENNNNNKDEAAATASGYASADDAVPHSRGERKRGVPWTEEEHKLFLLGLQKVGKGDWRGISRGFVKTRTPTQVASHAQKYFLRRSNLNRRRRRRSSLFDITTDSVTAMPMEEEQSHWQDNNKHNNASQLHLLPPTPLAPEASSVASFPAVLPDPIDSPIPMGNLSLGRANQALNPAPLIAPPNASTLSDLNLNSESPVDPSMLSLKLSLPSDQRESSSRHSAFEVMPSFSNGDGIIRVLEVHN